MTDSSSSEDDYRVKLLQAVDKQFMSDVLFSGKSTKCDQFELKSPTVLPSMRRNEDHLEQFNVSGLNVTPEFQKHVAKHLTRILDKQLKEVDQTKLKSKRLKVSENGVRLLYSSPGYVTAKDAEDISAAHNAKRKVRVNEEEDSEEEDSKVMESAVSTDWVLSGEATKGWARSTRGEVIPGLHKDSNVVIDKTNKKKKKKKKKENGEVNKV